MRIAKATTDVVGNPWKNWLIVRPDIDQTGLCGIGEGTLNLLVQELFDDTNVSWENDLLTNPVQVVDGRMQIPDGPGLSTDLNWSETKKHPYNESNFPPLLKLDWERPEGDQA